MPSIQQRITTAVSDASPSLARVGHWMSAHPIQTLSCSADEVASLTGTSVAAVNRFSRAAGFDGFAHLKASLGKELESVVDPVRKVGGARGKARGDVDIDADALQAAAAGPQVQRAAGRLLKARNVFVLGLGASSFVAGYAAHVLMPYLPQVYPLAGPGGTEVAARRLSHCAGTDVLLALSLPRYSTATVRMARFARERGTHVIAITDAAGNPLAQQADSLLLAPAQHSVMPSSALGALVVVEALASAVMRLNPDAVRIARELSEAVLAHLTTDGYIPDSNDKDET
ncbi:MurR/RpiR family transcriptional regulator [Schlegelella sp. S2-27]|uniref:MurR/RpiR family transcriptional regulator n=1 Tax=Caldimonas mangrovi TaxID=2944811 RepID=A0ABT0YT15_9BURK|nr:MurR/RpiR family transcriptional regulator [Caldimonas mangrovi]MCM5681894.1 MurR/RpiR family transcriptional regulator [Caldimonas mangrovi]